MLELPGAKQVRRNDLQSPVSSPRSSPDPALEDLLRSRIDDQYTFTATTARAQVDEVCIVADDDEEAELRLFAAPSEVVPQTYKIRLASPEEASGEGAFMVKRPRSYYFADNRASEKHNTFKAAAIDAKTVVAMSREPWPGCALPWKVQTVSPNGLKKAVLVGNPSVLVMVEEKLRHRKRKGKKTRIALRKKLQAAREKEDEQMRMNREKEEIEKEKRTRRNRAKKVKKKLRDKAKKLRDKAKKLTENDEVKKVDTTQGDTND